MTSYITLLLIVLAIYSAESSSSGANSKSKAVPNEKSRIFELEIRGKVFERHGNDQQPCTDPVPLTSVRLRIEPLGSIVTANTNSEGLFSVDVPLDKDLFTESSRNTMPVIRLCKGSETASTSDEKQICSNARISSNVLDRPTATKHLVGIEGAYTVRVKYIIDAEWCLFDGNLPENTALENAYSIINHDGVNLGREGEIERDILRSSNEGENTISQAQSDSASGSLRNEGNVKEENDISETVENQDAGIKSEKAGFKRTWGDSGMNWIKKSVGTAHKQRPHDAVSHVSGSYGDEYTNKKRTWGDSGASWIKRKGGKQSLSDAKELLAKQGEYKRTWGDSGATWMKRENDQQLWNHPGAAPLLEHQGNKRTWGDAGASWLKRKNEDQETVEDEDKRTWGDAGASWMKRRNGDQAEGDHELVEDKDKRTWGDAGASWIKRKNYEQTGSDHELVKDKDKRTWGDAGASWIKKNYDQAGGDHESIENKDKRTWGDAGASWIKREDMKRAWGDTGMNWVKKDGNLKRTWGDSGMGWIKRAPV